LRAIVVNVWRNRTRKLEPEWLLLDERHLPDPTPVEPAHGIDLERALALLPPGYRTVLLLHDREGLTHEEIGSALGISAGTSKSQLSNARARMRAVLAPGGYG
jgi:RNA polymerase sigma-70 factor (ECF subfamily)